MRHDLQAWVARCATNRHQNPRGAPRSSRDRDGTSRWRAIREILLSHGPSTTVRSLVGEPGLSHPQPGVSYDPSDGFRIDPPLSERAGRPIGSRSPAHAARRDWCWNAESVATDSALGPRREPDAEVGCAIADRQMPV